MAHKDITTKTIESYNDVFADIVNGFLFNGEKVISPDELIPSVFFRVMNDSEIGIMNQCNRKTEVYL